MPILTNWNKHFVNIINELFRIEAIVLLIGFDEYFTLVSTFQMGTEKIVDSSVQPTVPILYPMQILNWSLQ